MPAVLLLFQPDGYCVKTVTTLFVLCVLQFVCVCERSTSEVGCIEFKGGRGVKGGKVRGEIEGWEKRKGKIDIAVFGRVRLYPAL